MKGSSEGKGGGISTLTSSVAMRPSGGFVLAVLTAVNLVNYCDRGITPGAPDEFSQFIHETMNGERHNRIQYCCRVCA